MVNGGKITPSSGEETALARNKQDLGILGWLFGSRGNAPTNIAGAVVFLFILLLVVTITIPLAQGVDRADLIKAVLGLIASSLAYLFGAASARR
jgi:hypothetical protein